MSKCLAVLACGSFAALLAGCNPRLPAKRAIDECHASVGGQMLFVGEPKCMKTLPQQRMSGVWILGMEYSVFYEGASSVPAEAMSDSTEATNRKVWLDTDPENALERLGFPFDGNTHAYRVDFIGTKSDAPGVYGHFGVYKHSALALRILSAKEVPLPQSSSSS